jgi:SAM-dependent methyltransferase
MDINYLNPHLKQLSSALEVSFRDAKGLSEDERRICRFSALGVPVPPGSLSPAQRELLASLRPAVEYAKANGLADILGWCMVARDDGELGCSGAGIGRSITDFLTGRLAPEAGILDAACGLGALSLPLAKRGYRITMLDAADAFLEGALRRATGEGVSDRIESLLCGTLADLEKLPSNSANACICFGSLLYVQPPNDVRKALGHLGRIASQAVIVDVASKHGHIRQLHAESNWSEDAERQILRTGVTPPEGPENGSAIYSCFSSEEFCHALTEAGLEIEHLTGYGCCDADTVDDHPQLLAYCSKG